MEEARIQLTFFPPGAQTGGRFLSFSHKRIPEAGSSFWPCTVHQGSSPIIIPFFKKPLYCSISDIQKLPIFNGYTLTSLELSIYQWHHHTIYSTNIRDTCKSFLPPSFNPIYFQIQYSIICPCWEGRKEKCKQWGKQLWNYFRYTIALTKGIKELVGKHSAVDKRRYKCTEGSQEKTL